MSRRSPIASGFDEQIGLSAPELAIAGGLERFGLKGTFYTRVPSDADDVALATHAFSVGYRWDPSKADYVRFGSSTPLPDGG